MSSQVVEDMFSKTVNLSQTFSNSTPTAAKVSGRMGVLLKLKSLGMRVLKFITSIENWKSSPKLWIAAWIFLRLLLQFLREYGLTLFKKDLSKEHIFLTGAGNGLGRLMA